MAIEPVGSSPKVTPLVQKNRSSNQAQDVQKKKPKTEIVNRRKEEEDSVHISSTARMKLKEAQRQRERESAETRRSE